MFSWFFSSPDKLTNDDKFINAIQEHLIDTQDIQLSLYRASRIKYFDSEHYPISKNINSPIWFTVKIYDVVNYFNNYYTTHMPICMENVIPNIEKNGYYILNISNNENNPKIIKYNLNPGYKILNLRLANGSIDSKTIKIIADYAIDKIRNDDSKKQYIIDRAKKDEELMLDIETGQKNNDVFILNNVIKHFEKIYNDDRTGIRLADELLFEEIIFQMVRLNLVQRFNIVGFWNGYSNIFEGRDPVPEEMIIINSRMRECLTPMVKTVDPIQVNPIQVNPVQQESIKKVNIVEPQEEKIKKNMQQKKKKRGSELDRLRKNGGKNKKTKKIKNKKVKTKKIKTMKVKNKKMKNKK